MLVLILASIPAVLQDRGKYVVKGWETSYFSCPENCLVQLLIAAVRVAKPNDADLDGLWKK